MDLFWRCLGGHFRESVSLLRCTNYFSSIFTPISWVELSERPSSVGTFGRRERLLQQWGLHQYSRSCAPFFPSFSLLPFAAHTHTRLVVDSRWIKISFPVRRDEGLCKTSAKASELATFASIPLPPRPHSLKFPLQLEKKPLPAK